jgi:hypothetical protein
MPNHTDNRVTLYHKDSQQIDMIYNIMNTPDTPLCQTLIPMPKELEGTAGFDENGVAGWYKWRLDNWGTKWDVYDAQCDYFDANTLRLYFDTAWSPPMRIYEKLTDMGFEVTARYLDEGWGYIGEYVNGDDWCTNDVESVAEHYPELDEEFGISERIAEYQDEENAA